MSLVITGLIIIGGIYFYMAIQLPDVSQIKETGMQFPLRIYTSDGKLIGEFGEKKRIPVTMDNVPPLLIHAVLDTEDQRYYEHRGVDFISLVRAAKVVMASGKKSQGASTITMQVARNFFLNRDKTFTRKLNEILLAFKLDKTFSKKEILELYLNKIFLGQRAYGVAAAAQIYFGKPLQELNLAQLATLAGLPQAPSRDNPITNPKSALERRNHVLLRMYENGHINRAAYKAAIAQPIITHYHELLPELEAPYVAEMARNAVFEQFGDKAYELGLKIYTTIDSHLQLAANKSLRDGLLAYDRRHGYRGPEKHLALADQNSLKNKLDEMPIYNGLFPAIVINMNSQNITALLANGAVINIPQAGFAWARPTLYPGDVIRVERTQNNDWLLAQLPKVSGAIVVLNPKNGAIMALSGGFYFSYADSNYNRAVQAERQPGSAFKPFIYSAALAKGFTLASVINDAPIVMRDLSTNSFWRPQNDTQKFSGPTRLRIALTESRNVVSIRLLQATGIPFVVNYLKQFGFSGAEVPGTPSMALGTGVITPLKLATGYAVFANGGYKVAPFFINVIANQNNKPLFVVNPITIPEAIGKNQYPIAPRVITPQNAFLITSALKDVILYGSAHKAASMHRGDLAGKTGTTNDQNDAWFSGYNSDIVATVWLGFDQPQSTYEYGAQAALPIWMEFMEVALAGKPESSMQQPAGITTARIDPATGLLAEPGQKNAIFELFTSDTVPTTKAQSLSSPLFESSTDESGDKESLF